MLQLYLGIKLNENTKEMHKKTQTTLFARSIGGPYRFEGFQVKVV